MAENLADRIVAIRNRLAGHILTDLGIAVVTPSKATWQTFRVNGSHRFGWLPPVAVDDDEDLWLVSFCPQLIAEITLELDDHDLDTYLTMVEAFIDLGVARPELGPSEVIAQVEHEIYDSSPGALELLSRVEANAIDRGLVR